MNQNLVTQHLVEKLLENSFRTLISGNIVAILVCLAIAKHTDEDLLLIWFSTLTVVNVIRGVLSFRLLKHVKKNPKLIGNFYAAGAFLSGIIWGSIALLYQPDMPLIVQLYFLITLVGIPTGSLPSNGYYLPCFTGFSVPVLGALILWSIFLVPENNILFSTLAIIYSFLIMQVGNSYSANLRDNIKYVVENKRLLMELEEHNNRLATFAYKDPLTNLSNRREFETEATKLMNKNSNSDSIIALLLIDIDEFKQINDTHGHKAGDNLLKSVAMRILTASRESELILSKRYKAARIGGDEFLVLYQIPKEEASAVQSIANRIHNKISATVSLGENTLKPSLSIGIALSPQHSNNINQLIDFADKAMYQAKFSGGNCVVVYSSSV